MEVFFLYVVFIWFYFFSKGTRVLMHTAHSWAYNLSVIGNKNTLYGCSFMREKTAVKWAMKFVYCSCVRRCNSRDDGRWWSGERPWKGWVSGQTFLKECSVEPIGYCRLVSYIICSSACTHSKTVYTVGRAPVIAGSSLFTVVFLFHVLSLLCLPVWFECFAYCSVCVWRQSSLHHGTQMIIQWHLLHHQHVFF